MKLKLNSYKVYEINLLFNTIIFKFYEFLTNGAPIVLRKVGNEFFRYVSDILKYI